MMTYPLMPVLRRQEQMKLLGMGKLRPRRIKMRGGNVISDVGKTAYNIITSGNKKQAALNELKNWNTRLRNDKTISNFLKSRNNKTLQTIGNIASMAGYGRRRRKQRGRNIFKKAWSGIKKGVSFATKVASAPINFALDKVAQPVINYGVSKLLGGRKRKKTVKKPVRIHTLKVGVPSVRRVQSGGFLFTLPIATGLIKRFGNTLVDKGKEKLINYGKEKLNDVVKSITGGRRRKRKQKGGKKKKTTTRERR